MPTYTKEDSAHLAELEKLQAALESNPTAPPKISSRLFAKTQEQIDATHLERQQALQAFEESEEFGKKIILLDKQIDKLSHEIQNAEEEAEQFSPDSEKILGKLISIMQRQEAALQQHIKANVKLKDPTKALKAVQVKVDANQKAIQEGEAQYESARKQLGGVEPTSDAIKARERHLKKEIDAAKKETNPKTYLAAINELEIVKHHCPDLAKLIDKLKAHRGEEILKEIEKAQVTDLSSLEDVINQSRAAIGECQNIIKKEQGNIVAQQKIIEGHSEKITQLQAKLAAYKEQVADFPLKKIENYQKSLIAEISEIQSKLADAAITPAQRAELQEELAEYEQDLAKNKERLETWQDINDVEQEIQTVKNQAKDAQKQSLQAIAEANQSIANLYTNQQTFIKSSETIKDASKKIISHLTHAQQLKQHKQNLADLPTLKSWPKQKGLLERAKEKLLSLLKSLTQQKETYDESISKFKQSDKTAKSIIEIHQRAKTDHDELVAFTQKKGNVSVKKVDERLQLEIQREALTATKAEKEKALDISQKRQEKIRDAQVVIAQKWDPDTHPQKLKGFVKIGLKSAQQHREASLKDLLSQGLMQDLFVADNQRAMGRRLDNFLKRGDPKVRLTEVLWEAHEISQFLKDLTVSMTDPRASAEKAYVSLQEYYFKLKNIGRGDSRTAKAIESYLKQLVLLYPDMSPTLNRTVVFGKEKSNPKSGFDEAAYLAKVTKIPAIVKDETVETQLMADYERFKKASHLSVSSPTPASPVPSGMPSPVDTPEESETFEARKAQTMQEIQAVRDRSKQSEKLGDKAKEPSLKERAAAKAAKVFGRSKPVTAAFGKKQDEERHKRKDNFTTHVKDKYGIADPKDKPKAPK